MRVFSAIALAVMLGAASPAMAEDPSTVSPADRDAIMAVIRDQLAAFQHDDAAKAFGFAAPNIQGLFGHDPEQFMSMVRNGYQPVYRPRSTQFGSTETVQGQIVQHVEVDGPDGVSPHRSLHHGARGRRHVADQRLRADGRRRRRSLTDAGKVGPDGPRRRRLDAGACGS